MSYHECSEDENMWHPIDLEFFDCDLLSQRDISKLRELKRLFHGGEGVFDAVEGTTLPATSQISVVFAGPCSEEEILLNWKENLWNVCPVGQKKGDIPFNQGIIDCGACLNVIGIKRLGMILRALKEQDIPVPVILPSKRKLRYADGNIGLSKGMIHLPIRNPAFELVINVEIIDGDTPLLLGLPALKTMESVIDFSRKRMWIRKRGNARSVKILSPLTNTFTIQLLPDGISDTPRSSKPHFVGMLSEYENSDGNIKQSIADMINARYRPATFQLPVENYKKFC
ncbi:unnamed protein product, partial [Amoebophrya sp. A25]|eukprot:GSA25T00001704001.1